MLILKAQAGYSWAQSYGAESRNSDGSPATDNGLYGSGHDVPTGISKMPDGGFVVAGQIDLPELLSGDTGSNSCGTIVRYGPQGTIIWQRMLRQNNDWTDGSGFHPGVSHINAVKTDAQGNVYVCGIKLMNGDQMPAVAKLSPSGRILWQNGIFRASWTQPDHQPAIATGVGEFGTIGLTADGGVVVASSVFEPGNAHSVPVVVKFNGDGTVGFLTALEVPVQYLGAVSVCQSYDGKSYVVIIPYNGTSVVKLGAGGNIVSQINYPDDYSPIQVIATPDNGYAILNRIGNSVGVPPAGLVIRKINSNLNDKFGTKISRQALFGGGCFNCYSLSLTNDGGYLVGGYDSIGQDAALMRIKASGALASVSLLGGPNADGSECCHAIQLNDGGYAFAASTLSYVGSCPFKPDWWVVKANASRRVSGFAGKQFDHSIDPNTGDPVGDPPFIQTNVTGAGSPSTAFTFISHDAVRPIAANSIAGSKVMWVGRNPAAESPPNAPYVLIQALNLPPEIVVEQPIGTGLVDGGVPIDFEKVAVGTTGLAKLFTIKNVGKGELTGLAITKSGTQAKDFIVTGPVKTSLAGGAYTTFKVKFKPSAVSPTGMFSTATIHIKSNDSNENPFDIKLKAKGVAP